MAIGALMAISTTTVANAGPAQLLVMPTAHTLATPSGHTTAVSSKTDDFYTDIPGKVERKPGRIALAKSGAPLSTSVATASSIPFSFSVTMNYGIHTRDFNATHTVCIHLTPVDNNNYAVNVRLVRNSDGFVPTPQVTFQSLAGQERGYCWSNAGISGFVYHFEIFRTYVNPPYGANGSVTAG